MKNWIISESEVTNTYFIATEKSIWLSDQKKNVDINELIATKTLDNIESITYEDVKEIIFIDSEYIIEFNYLDDKITDKEFRMDENIYIDIKSYLKNHLKETELKNYPIFKQIASQLTVLGVSVFFVGLIYHTATELEKGESIRISGRRSWLKKIIVSIAELLGSIGVLIVGIILISIMSYFIIKKIKNPKKGELLKMTKYSKLVY